MSFGLTGSLSFSNTFENFPLTIPNCFAWWEADSAAITSGTIDTLFDKSKNNSSTRNLIKVGATGPTFNFTDLDFGGRKSISTTIANRRLEASAFNVALSQSFTCYLVQKINASANTAFWRTLSGNFDNAPGFIVNSSGTLTMQCLNAGPAVTSPGTYNDNLVHISCCIYDGTSSLMFLDDAVNAIAASTGDGSVSVTSATGVTIGTFGSAVDMSWSCQIFYEGAHDENTRQRLFNYLKTKYKL